MGYNRFKQPIQADMNVNRVEAEILFACLALPGPCVPSAIHSSVSERNGEGVIAGFSTIYFTLDRLVTKRLLTESSTRDTRGRTRRAFSTTPAARVAVNRFFNIVVEG